MNIDALSDTIDFASRDFSLLLVSPKQPLLEWLRTFMVAKQLEAYRLYIPEENTVLVIPNRDRFAEPNSFDEFLNYMKPKLLRLELTRFCNATAEEFGKPMTTETFDEFFKIAIRDSAAIRFMSDFKGLS